MPERIFVKGNSASFTNLIHMPMNPSYSRTPWQVTNETLIVSGDGSPAELIADTEDTPPSMRPAPISEKSKANALRIVECVNACSSLDNPEKLIPDLIEALRECQKVLFNHVFDVPNGGEALDMMDFAEAEGYALEVLRKIKDPATIERAASISG